MTPRATSVLQSGEADGWSPEPGWHLDRGAGGVTRLVVSVPPAELPRVHGALVGALSTPIGFLWRQRVDRRDPRPNGAPPRDFVALDLPLERVRAALGSCGPVIYGDARADLWLRGRLGEQLVLDADGIVYVYPDDPSARETLTAAGVPERDVPTLADRDYVRHWFHAENDALEERLMSELHLSEVPYRRG